MATLRFRGRPVPVTAGSDLLGALLDAGEDAPYLCMAGSCGTCRVRVRAGAEHLAPCTASELAHRLRPGERLACQAVFTGGGDVTIEP